MRMKEWKTFLLITVQDSACIDCIAFSSIPNQSPPTLQLLATCLFKVKWGLLCKMRTKWGPFQQFGPHEGQGLNWGPLRKHCYIQKTSQSLKELFLTGQSNKRTSILSTSPRAVSPSLMSRLTSLSSPFTPMITWQSYRKLNLFSLILLWSPRRLKIFYFCHNLPWPTILWGWCFFGRIWLPLNVLAFLAPQVL